MTLLSRREVLAAALAASTASAQTELRIDAHHHMWRYNAKEYDWIEGAAALSKDFLLPQLREVAKSAGITGFVSVQARTIVEETNFLLDLAAKEPLIKAVVGWVPLTDPGVAKIIEKFAGNKKLKGMRHVLQGEPNDYCLRPDFNKGVAALEKAGLRYDVLIKESQLPNAIKFVDMHPKQTFILDHIAKPSIKTHVLSPWKENMKELAKRQNVYCKVSGMITEADQKNWTAKDLQPYFDATLDAFTPKRLMFGSDWPVELLAAPTYKKWFDTVNAAFQKLSATERQRIFSGTAIEAYGL